MPGQAGAAVDQASRRAPTGAVTGDGDPSARPGNRTAAAWDPWTPHWPATTPPPAGKTEKFALGYRRWGSKNWAALDSAVKPAGCGAWRNRALRWLPGGHRGAEQLLELVHLEVGELSPAREAQLAAQAGVRFDLAEVNAVIADGIVYAWADGVGAR